MENPAFANIKFSSPRTLGMEVKYEHQGLLLTSIIFCIAVPQKPVLGKTGLKLHGQCKGADVAAKSFRRVSTAGMCLMASAFEPGR